MAPEMLLLTLGAKMLLEAWEGSDEATKAKVVAAVLDCPAPLTLTALLTGCIACDHGADAAGEFAARILDAEFKKREVAA